MNHGNEYFNTASALVLFFVLIVSVATDIKNRRIPNALLLPALVLAVILHSISGGVEGLITTAGGLTLGLAMLFPLYAMGGMGAGDVKLLGVVGGFLGPWGAVVAGLATFMAGAVLGIAIIIWRRIWPVFEINASHALSSHPHGVNSQSSTHTRQGVTTIPYAPAIATGTVAALWYIDLLPFQLTG
jgi:prepilin peptidase CpaA